MGNRVTRNDPRANCDNLEYSGQRQDSADFSLASGFQKNSSLSLGSESVRKISTKSTYNGSSQSLGSLLRRQKSSTKSFTSSLRYPKTSWPTPLTETIFLSHFKKQPEHSDFKIDGIIAKGAFGSVVKVLDSNKPDTVCALKILQKSKIISENCVKQIKEEVDIQKLCGHFQFIVRQLDTWQSKRSLYILSEYVPNGELFSKIYNIPVELVRLYVAEISLAIDFLHNAGVIYRDVKPENILLTEDYHIKLTDFGLSKWLRNGDKTRTWCGTTQYMAPEILRGEAYGHEVDWWSLGVLACLMLCKQYPNTQSLLVLPESQLINSEESQFNGVAKTKKADFYPTEFESIPNDGKDLLKRLLESNPRYRLKSVMALQRIAFYKNYPIDMKALFQISPQQILEQANINWKSKEEKLINQFDGF